MVVSTKAPHQIQSISVLQVFYVIIIFAKKAKGEEEQKMHQNYIDFLWCMPVANNPAIAWEYIRTLAEYHRRNWEHR